MGIFPAAKLAILLSNKFQVFLRLLKRELRQADIFLIVANLVPVFGVWFLGWNAIEAFIVYAMETLIVGMLTLLKMLVVTLVS